MKSHAARVSVFAVLGMSALILSACAPAPTTDPAAGGGGEAASDVLPCIVSDSAGWDDKSFNQSALEGITTAAADLGVEPVAVESTSESDFAPNIQSLVDQGCTLIVTVGFALSQATVEAALANPDIDFAIVDDAADNDGDGAVDAPNIKPILFNSAQAGFLAGYTAASYTQSGIVATWGGMAFPPVQIFSDGFAQGIAHHNAEKGTDVKLLGYDLANPSAYTVIGGFEANETARSAAQNFIDQGADILLPVGGPIYQSAVAAISDSGKDVALVGVDVDLFVSDPSTEPVILTSILKGITAAVGDVVTTTSTDGFDVTAYVGSLENDGIGLAGFHNFEGLVSPDLQGELDALRAGIIDGSIDVQSYLN